MGKLSPEARRPRQDRELYLAVRDCPALQACVSAFRAATGTLLQFLPSEPTADELLRALRRAPFVALLMRSEKERSACLNRAFELCASLRQTWEPALAKPIFGVVHLGLPLKGGGSAAGILFAGPISGKAASSSFCQQVADRLAPAGVRVSPQEVRTAFSRVPIVPVCRLQKALPFLSLFASQFAEATLSSLLRERECEPPCVGEAKAFIGRNLFLPLSQREVARHVGVSADHFGKVFRATTHLSCKQYIARARLEQVKRELLDPSCRVIEAAFGAGFQSIAQFNRVFKKYVGANPSQYRASRRREDLGKCAEKPVK